MRIFVTADYHLGHKNISELSNRPIKDVLTMSMKIVQNHNIRVTKEDQVFHLGDFAFKTGKLGMKVSPQTWENMLNGKIIHIMGNHDYKNNIKGGLTKAFINYANMNIMMQHIPPVSVSADVDMVLCGHVHRNWKMRIIDNKPVVNVGVDVWNYTPIKLDDVIKYVQREMRK